LTGATAIGHEGGIWRQGKVGKDFSQEKVGTQARVDQAGVFANPTQASPLS
jgi:hypothetical protein